MSASDALTAEANQPLTREEQPSYEPPSTITLEQYAAEPRPLKFVGVREFYNEKSEREMQKEVKSLVKFMTCLHQASLVVSLVLFLCQAGAAFCWCRPEAVLGGVLVSILFLCQGILGIRVIKIFSQPMLIGYACLSGFVSLCGLGSALFFLSGQFTVACVSAFHSLTQESVTRLQIIEGLSLVSSVPCLLGAIACFLAAALSAKASKRPKRKIPEPQLFLYLHPCNKEQPGLETETSPKLKENGVFPSAPGPHGALDRSRTPPPSYIQVNEESFA